MTDDQVLIGPAAAMRIGTAIQRAVAAVDDLNVGGCWAHAHAGAAVLRSYVGGDWQVVAGHLACSLLDFRRVYQALGLFEGMTYLPRDGTSAEVDWIVGPPGLVDLYAWRYPAIARQAGITPPPLPPIIWGDVPPFLHYTPHEQLTHISHAIARKHHVFLRDIIRRALAELGAADAHDG